MTPLVTIGMTAFDAEASIARAVRSALAQQWRPLEIVVVDDASRDATGSILAGLAAAHPELRVFTQPANGGVAAARNRVIAEAKGEFVCFFDDDDESAPERVGAQLDRILAYERDFAGGAPVICHTARRLLHADGSSRIAPTMGEMAGRPAPAGPAVAHRILAGTPLADGNGACPTCSQMARTSLYRALGGFDPALRRAEDTEFSIRLARAGGHFVGIGTPLVHQRMTLTADKTLADERRYALAVIDKHRDLFASAARYRFARDWLELKHDWLARRRLAFAARLLRLGANHPVGTTQRLLRALPNFGINRAFRQFHAAPRA